MLVIQVVVCWVVKQYSDVIGYQPLGGPCTVKLEARLNFHGYKHLNRIQNGSRAHPAFYPMGTRGSFPGGKAAGA
jgi:hypothetical protein